MWKINPKYHRWDALGRGALTTLVFAFCGGMQPATVVAQEVPLKQPYEIATAPNVQLLETTLKIKKLSTSYEYWENITPGGSPDPACYERTSRYVDLRMYGYPNPRDGSLDDCGNETCYGFPGPTYRMRRASTGNPSYPGDEYHLTLFNHLDLEPPGCRDENGPVDPKWGEVPPNCFHEADVTNHHFHGFHVSPGKNANGTYQDYIYLKIYPQGEAKDQTQEEDSELGSAVYELSPLTEGQHEGTHWYHPHKHGATALQLGNGMAGAFVVEGPYDDWLEGEVCEGVPGCALKEQVLVIQEIMSNFVFPPNPSDPIVNSDTLVNGQLYPTLEMAPGEIQRWRVLNAAMKAASAFHFTFPPGFVVREIGMDGVPFVAGNYDRQPLLGWVQEGSGDCVISGGTTTGARCILMHPGNRADFLVQHPTVTRRSKRANAGQRFEVSTKSIVHKRKFFSEQTYERTLKPAPVSATMPRSTKRGSAKSTCAPPNFENNKPGLFTVKTCTSCTTPTMNFPLVGNYLLMPSLADITDQQVDGRLRTVPYSMQGYTGAKFPAKNYTKNSCEWSLLKQINDVIVACPYLLPKFTIDGRQFSHGTTPDFTMELGSSEEWSFPNGTTVPEFPAGAAACPGLEQYLVRDGGGVATHLTGTVATDENCTDPQPITMAMPLASPIQHPVHLHVNPFQVRTALDGRLPGTPYVWQDVMGLDIPGDQDGNATMRTSFLEFAGEFVMHCHILGHEDRGMMQNLEVEDPALQK
jgi:FtsP/CotA-like multicopper oxidase with cupredoxin domain